MRRNVILLFIIAGAVLFLNGSKGVDSSAPLEREVLRLKHQLDSVNQELDSFKNRVDSLHELSWESIDYWMDRCGVSNKEAARLQIYLETDNLRSDICRENSNLFGMRVPRVRKNLVIGENREHAMFESFIHSLRDYKMWQEEMGMDNEMEVDKYLAALVEKGYAEDIRYRHKLKNLKKRNDLDGIFK